MSNTVLLGDIASLKTGPFGTQLSASEYVNAGIPVINVRNIGYGEIITSYLEYVDEETAKRLHEHLLHKGDIVFGRKGSVDRHAFIDTRYDGWMQGSDCIRVRINEGINPHYISHYLKLESVKKQINSSAVGSTMASLNTDILGRIQIVLPSLEIQNRIEKLLSVIEEKIDLNKHLCTEMEAMAKTLYDYWFVQFDFPDENVKPYRTSGGAMEKCKELGREVPKGWKAGTLSDIANITMGQSPAGESYNENGDGMMFFQGSTDFGSRFPMPRVYTTAPTRFAKNGDILMSVRAPVGALNIAMEDCCIGRGLAALNSKIGSQIYLIQLLNNFRAVFDSMNGNGTTFGSINKDTLHALKVIIPPNSALQQFEEIVTPIEKQIRECEKENRKLSSLRDWLLPMLMNGQARIEKEEIQ